ncbi:MAG: glycoside hydrolase family 3 N-terminal domain-containing protein, partial [Candidatus Korobacteraceae bacterium]
APDEVIRYAREFLRGLKDVGILGSGKHFPGLGEGKLDTHHELPQISKSMRQLWEEDLLPYRTLHRSLPFVMVSHAAYPQATRQPLPATLSRKLITDVLRKRIGYRGLIVTDDMDMGALLAAAPIETAAVETLRAGSNLIMVCRDTDRALAGYEAVVCEGERDRRFAAKLTEKAKHVLRFKKKSNELQRHAPRPKQADIDRLRRELWELGEQARMTALAR